MPRLAKMAATGIFLSVVADLIVSYIVLRCDCAKYVRFGPMRCNIIPVVIVIV